MIRDYIATALRHARYEVIENPEPYFGTIEGLQGVWATGKTLAECKRNLAEVLDDWIVVRLTRGMRIPPIAGAEIAVREEAAVA